MPIKLTRLSTILCLSLCVSACATQKPIIEYVPKEIVKVETTPIPLALLTKRCENVQLSDSVTRRDFEERAMQLWICVQAQNMDKDDLQGLK